VNTEIKEDDIPTYIKQGKDREVVPLLYKKVFPVVERYIIRNSGKKDDALDVFQDALMLLYRQIIENTFNSKYKVYGYLYKICTYKWINKAKKNSKISFIESIEDDAVQEEFDMPEVSQINVDENLIRKLFSPIGEKCIELLTYTIYNNLLMEDIMIRMELNSVSAVKMQSKRCKEKLVKEIEKNPALIDLLRK